MVVIANLGISLHTPPSLSFFSSFTYLLAQHFTLHSLLSQKRLSFFKTCSRNALPVSILQTAGLPTIQSKTFSTIKIMVQPISNETFQREKGCKGSNAPSLSARQKWPLTHRNHSRKNSTSGLSMKVPVGFFSFHGYSSIC